MTHEELDEIYRPLLRADDSYAALIVNMGVMHLWGMAKAELSYQIESPKGEHHAGIEQATA